MIRRKTAPVRRTSVMFGAVGAPELTHDIQPKTDSDLHSVALHGLWKRDAAVWRIGIAQGRRHTKAQHIGHIWHLLPLIAVRDQFATKTPPETRSERSRSLTEVSRVLSKSSGQQCIGKEKRRRKIRSIVAKPLSEWTSTGTILRTIVCSLVKTCKHRRFDQEGRIKSLSIRHFKFLPCPQRRNGSCRILDRFISWEKQQYPSMRKRTLGQRRIELRLSHAAGCSEGTQQQRSKCVLSIHSTPSIQNFQKLHVASCRLDFWPNAWSGSIQLFSSRGRWI